MTTTPTQHPPQTAALACGLSHAAVVTTDVDRLASFYREVFGLDEMDVPAPPGTRSVTLRLSDTSALVLYESAGDPCDQWSAAMLDRGRIDHIAIDVPTASALEEVRRRLVARDASDGEVHDYGPMLAVSFTDPGGMASEACWVREPSFANAHHPEPFTGSLRDLDA